jgi:hypothetical protein
VGVVRLSDNNATFNWHDNLAPADNGESPAIFINDAVRRARELQAWYARLLPLIRSIDEWGKESEWSTRRISKGLDDPIIGHYEAPALLLQQETLRVLVEPVGRSSPGTEGVVDIYLLPAYDDIATLYYYQGQWQLHYLFPNTPISATIDTVQPRALSKETLTEVLDEMKKHATGSWSMVEQNQGR